MYKHHLKNSEDSMGGALNPNSPYETEYAVRQCDGVLFKNTIGPNIIITVAEFFTKSFTRGQHNTENTSCLFLLRTRTIMIIATDEMLYG